MGDVLLTTPALRLLRAAFPAARIDYLSRAIGLAVLAGNANVDERLTYRDGALRVLRLLRSVRARAYDTVIDFHSTPGSAWVVRASRADRRIGTEGRGPRTRAYTDLTPRRGDVRRYAALRYIDMLAPLGVEPGSDPDTSLDLRIEDGDRAWAAAEWQRHGLDAGAPLVAISAVARDAAKQWGAARWARVADAVAEAGRTVVLTHGPGEAEQAAAVAAAMRRPPAAILGATSPQRLGALYARAELWVGHDGGPRHVAVAAGVRTLSVARAGYGADWTDPSAPSGHRFVEAPAPSRGARHDARGGLDRLEPEAVIGEALAMLDEDSV